MQRHTVVLEGGRVSSLRPAQIDPSQEEAKPVHQLITQMDLPSDSRRKLWVQHWITRDTGVHTHAGASVRRRLNVIYFALKRGWYKIIPTS